MDHEDGPSSSALKFTAESAYESSGCGRFDPTMSTTRDVIRQASYRWSVCRFFLAASSPCAAGGWLGREDIFARAEQYNSEIFTESATCFEIVTALFYIDTLLGFLGFHAYGGSYETNNVHLPTCADRVGFSKTMRSNVATRECRNQRTATIRMIEVLSDTRLLDYLISQILKFGVPGN